MTSAHPIRLAVDIGGTFTDVALDASSGRVTVKVLTTPEAPERAVIESVAAATAKAGCALCDIDLIIHGTTLATNALIERKGAATALITTEGFRDSLEIGYEDRFEQYDIQLEKPQPLVPRRLRYTVPERMSAAGMVLRALDEHATQALVAALEQERIASVAIGLLHSYANPVHEQRIRDILLERLPKLLVTLSSEVIDSSGIPAPEVHYNMADNARRMLDFHIARATESMEAAGAYKIEVDRLMRYSGWHLLGTARMGNDSKTSVVDRWNRAHDVKNLYVVDGSCFVTSSGVNPTSTIVAIALRAAEHMVETRFEQQVPA